MKDHAIDIRVISIGTLSANPLWNEREPVRTGHSTTTLVRSGDVSVIVDPGLPAPALAARLGERAGIGPESVTHVFLTSFNPECRRGLALFDHAPWLMSEREREGVGVPLAQSLARLAHNKQAAEDAGEDQHDDEVAMMRVLQSDVALLQRFGACPDSIAPGIDLFPLPGVSPGMSGLLISERESTTLICGDAIATREHLVRGRVLASASDREQAMESFTEATEIADDLVLGRDNIVRSASRRRTAQRV